MKMLEQSIRICTDIPKLPFSIQDSYDSTSIYSKDEVGDYLK